jgi:multidrug transporter EmrE-like cation transporter
MEKNVGTADAVVRALGGVGLIVVAALVSDRPFLALGAALIGLLLLGTATTHVCPLYTTLGFRTCRTAAPAQRI